MAGHVVVGRLGEYFGKPALGAGPVAIKPGRVDAQFGRDVLAGDRVDREHETGEQCPIDWIETIQQDLGCRGGGEPASTSGGAVGVHGFDRGGDGGAQGAFTRTGKGHEVFHRLIGEVRPTGVVGPIGGCGTARQPSVRDGDRADLFQAGNHGRERSVASNPLSGKRRHGWSGPFDTADGAG
ncbi:hypothetical protein KV112_22800 [Mycolicibacter sp. MYC123]|uniref:Uncharacterized protein n=1 Tax=[Mycobacterium] zoologicum TaxID=2872311 RepID=A0ABU5YU76_9MYCO|nr:hypothetical protein [Mycolicibacter sp. MYC123]